MEQVCIETKKLNKKFSDGRILIADYDIKIKMGQRLCLFCDDENGQTMLLNIITGIENEYFGEVFINGVNRREFENSKSQISYMLKEPVFFDRLSVEDNLAYIFFKKFKNLNFEEKELVESGLSSYSLQEIRNEKCKKLNLFQKKLLNLCRIFIKNPDIILIDQPFVGLSSEEKDAVCRGVDLLSINKSPTVVCVDNGQNLKEFNGFDFLSFNFFGKNDAKSIDAIIQNPIDIFSYFFCKYGKLFVADEKFFSSHNIRILRGKFSVDNSSVVINNTFFPVVNKSLVSVYKIDQSVNVFACDDMLFDYETGLNLAYFS